MRMRMAIPRQDRCRLVVILVIGVCIKIVEQWDSEWDCGSNDVRSLKQGVEMKFKKWLR